MQPCHRSLVKWLINFNLRKMPMYKREIEKLFGDHFIPAIIKLIKKGTLTREKIKAIADSMGVRDEFDKYKDKECDLIYIFECILDAWYADFKKGPPTAAEAQKKFLSFLRENHCENYVIYEVENAFKSKLKVTN